jgi:glyoxylase-like metal-dependent hydrolase (beta-lactamase superfamily II)
MSGRSIEKVRIRGVLALALATLALSAAVAGGPEELDLVEVSPSVVMLQNERGSNITCIALDDGLVFVDTGLSTEVAARFRTTMEERFKRKTQALLLTHGHLDHIFAMGAFADVKVVAAEAGRPLIEHQLSIEFDEKAIAVYTGIFPTFAEDVGTAEPFLPTVWFAEEIVLGPDDRPLVFRNTGGHSADSSYAYLAAEGVLVSGDLVQVDKYPYFGDVSTDLAAWIAALESWHEMKVTKVCPGHGRSVGRDYLPPIWRYFESLIATLTRLKAEGATVEQAVVHPDLPAGYWPDDQAEPRWWKMCIARAFQTLESGPEQS